MKMHAYEKKHLQIVRNGLAECTVLLKSNGDFPLSEPGRIAAYGSGVRHTEKGGTGSGEVNSRFFITIEEGLEQEGFTVTTKEWLDSYEKIRNHARVNFRLEVMNRARENKTNPIAMGMGAVMPEPEYKISLLEDGMKKNRDEEFQTDTETAIYVVGRISGEGNDRNLVAGDYLLNESEIRDILFCAEHYKRFMLVINAGGPVDLSPVLDVPNILVLSQLGVETGACLAGILLGKEHPSGKLSTSWATREEIERIEFGSVDDTRYTEGIYVGYRYYDSFDSKVLFPFGYGLSFTTFEAREIHVRMGSMELIGESQDTVAVRVRIKNTGMKPGKEVLQLYVSVPSGRLDQPYQTLAAFAKTSLLRPGASEEITLKFRVRELASYDSERQAYILEKGTYVLRLGNSSRNTMPVGNIELDGEAIVKKVRTAVEKPSFDDIRCDRRGGMYSNAVQLMTEFRSCLSLDLASYELPVRKLRSNYIQQETVSYVRKERKLRIVKRMSDKTLAYMLIGSHDPKGGFASVIGAAGTHVAGAAGESSSILDKHGVPAIIMADGPAGLRLSRHYYAHKDGVRGVGSPIPEAMTEMMPAVVRGFLKVTNPRPAKNVKILHQYATAIPIGTAIAQSFNTEYAMTLGEIVGDEMDRFGIHLWLAPALNIHRNVRCGRNFEYYSEDPLVSGRMASAITKGIQKKPGRGVTIKHFCANNQETNRYANNSIVSERALRDIYLRGFDICVREAKPASVMTSYNLLNGIHTSESRELTEDVLRCEMGFDGIVMTDWLAGNSLLTIGTAYGEPEAWKIVAAGCELIMPGGKADYKNVLTALEDGRLKREDLEKNVSRLIRMARRLHLRGDV
ncbi:MAG: glycoside hydrolase family 3 C-terminal domain-containing protein [Lachnospiraceae bacterium]|nr:glycoside hydrolase family 3 C-terminal domain-containing protein [Candidatus Merdinaster equi]